jgi:hypothetical protein
MPTFANVRNQKREDFEKIVKENKKEDGERMGRGWGEDNGKEGGGGEGVTNAGTNVHDHVYFGGSLVRRCYLL